MLRFSHLTGGSRHSSSIRTMAWKTFAIGALLLVCGVPSRAAGQDVGPGAAPPTAPPPASPVEANSGKPATTSPTVGTASGTGVSAARQKGRSRVGRDNSGRRGHLKMDTAAITPRVVLLFPPDVSSHITTGVVPPFLTGISSEIQETRLQFTGVYEPVFFIGSLPSIRRANTEGTLSNADLNPPFDANAKLQKIISATLYDMALVSSIDDYQFDPTTRQVSIVMSVRLIDFFDSSRSRTASESYPFTTNPTVIPQSTSERILATQAIRDITERLMSEVLPKGMAPVTAAPRRHK